MNDISNTGPFHGPALQALRDDAKATASELPKTLKQDLHSGFIEFTGNGELSLGFVYSERRISSIVTKRRETALGELEGAAREIIAEDWVECWLAGGRGGILGRLHSRTFGETCPTCTGVRKETCPTCSGHGHNRCTAWGCSNGEVNCTSCDGSGKSTCRICNGGGTKDERKFIGNNWETVRVRCDGCAGSGYSGMCWGCTFGKVSCSTCRGTAKVRCQPCSASGKITCRNCQGLGEVGLEMTMTPKVTSTIKRTPDDRHDTFSFCLANVPGYLDQASAQDWKGLVYTKDGTTGSFRFKSGAHHTTTCNTSPGQGAELWVGHETAGVMRTPSYFKGLAQPATVHLDALAFEKLRGYPLGRDILKRLVSGATDQADAVTRYKLKDELSEPMARAGRSIRQYIRKGEWNYLGFVLAVGTILAALQNSPSFLSWFSTTISDIVGYARMALFYVPWLLLIITVLLLERKRRARASQIAGSNIRPGGRIWAPAAALLLTTQISIGAVTAFVDTPISEARRAGCNDSQMELCNTDILLTPIIGGTQSSIERHLKVYWPPAPFWEGDASSERVVGERRPLIKPSR